MTVLFLCSGNAARSQMAEALFRARAPSDVQVHSAGITPSAGLHPRAIAAMAEKGLDISANLPKALDSLPQPLDLVVTVCSKAAENCPVIPGATMLHWDVDDPTAVQGSDEEKMAAFRKVRDQLERSIDDLLASLSTASHSQ